MEYKVQKKLYAIRIIWFFILGYSSSLCAYPLHKPIWSSVEKQFLIQSGRREMYPNEYFSVIQVKDQYMLGKLTALRFIEWVQTHPNGVVALTSGNTPEYFIKFLYYYKKYWHKANVQEELRNHGIKSKDFPNTSNLKLVQVEELYPIAPNHTQKISNYTLRNYVACLGIKPQNLLLMDIEQRGIIAEKGINIVFMNGIVDLSVLSCANSQLELWQQRALKELYAFCKDYERRIRAWGGIDFFVGGLTLSGHLAFNEPGGSVDSKTHVVSLDYSTAACVSQRVGGMDYARGKLAITIGLGTINIKPDAVKIIIASGGSKAEVVRNAIENKTTAQYPSSVLQQYKNSRFYITDGAASLLEDRKIEDLNKIKQEEWVPNKLAEILIPIAKDYKKSILSLRQSDLEKYRSAKVMLANSGRDFETIKQEVHNTIVARIIHGVEFANYSKNKSLQKDIILHTAPHHEDIILGCYPWVASLTKMNNYFAYFTSGFNSVSDNYVLRSLNNASDGWLDKYSEQIFNKPYVSLLSRFKSAYMKGSNEQLATIDMIFVMRSLVSVYNINDINVLKNRIRWLKDEYFPSRQPGDLNGIEVQVLKGLIRESEAERQLILNNVPLDRIMHLRSKFYTGHEFKHAPSYNYDILPFANLLNELKPNLITLQDDPQSGPPSTNYKVLQIIAHALKQPNLELKKNLDIIGYRNQLYQYQLTEANIYMPIDEKTLAQQQKMYSACFNTQKMASFPSPFYAGDHASYTNVLHNNQLNELKLLVGNEFFENNPEPIIKNAKGVLLLNKMRVEELIAKSKDLQPEIDLDETFIN